MVGYERCGITFLLLILAIFARCAKHRVVICALIIEYMVKVKSLWTAVHVPFAHHPCGIACLLKQFAKECSGGIDAFSQLSLTVLVTVKTSDKTCATGG